MSYYRISDFKLRLVHLRYYLLAGQHHKIYLFLPNVFVVLTQRKLARSNILINYQGIF